FFLCGLRRGLVTGQHPLKAEMMLQANIIKQLGCRPDFTSLDLADLSPRYAELFGEVRLSSSIPNVLDFRPKCLIVDRNIFSSQSVRPNSSFIVDRKST